MGCELLHPMEYKGILSAVQDQGHKCMCTPHARHPGYGAVLRESKDPASWQSVFFGTKIEEDTILEAHRMLKNEK